MQEVGKTDNAKHHANRNCWNPDTENSTHIINSPPTDWAEWNGNSHRTRQWSKRPFSDERELETGCPKLQPIEVRYEFATHHRIEIIGTCLIQMKINMANEPQSLHYVISKQPNPNLLGRRGIQQLHISIDWLTVSNLLCTRTLPEITQQLVQDLSGVTVCLNDILNSGVDAKDHLENLCKVLQRLLDNKLQCRLEKCVFAKASADCLGHQLSSEGIAKGHKIEASCEEDARAYFWNELRSFLGAMQFYNKFLPNL